MFDTLVALVQRMVAESGNPIAFDAKQWLNRWLHEPVPALGGRLPVEFLHTPDGAARKTGILASMQTGTYQ
ncbi:MbcA/ParS/Xre antitoxin family protein [Paraburkholderia megapolitana]|uniref:MbcA/ParS/Xre antitoxin family protein n=1 Tax=Paraburkholderia megapolitana TaxID=420953 RepID=UPI0038BD3087